MDRYMNDTHSHYYNVDHSSMYGSNLSTVFADSPPPLEEDVEDDHEEFVFSTENDAIGEAVLTKIEGKLQKSAETEGESEWSDFADFNSGEENDDGAIQSNNFVAFADFNTSNTNYSDTGELPLPEIGSESKPSSLPRINGFSDNKEGEHVISESEGSDSDGGFGDFSSGLVDENSLEDNGQKLSNKPNHVRKNDKSGSSIDNCVKNDTGSNLFTSFDNGVDFSDFSVLNDKTGSTSGTDFTEIQKDSCSNEKEQLANSQVIEDDQDQPQTESNPNDSEFDDFSDDCSEGDGFGGFQRTTSDNKTSLQTDCENTKDENSFDRRKWKDSHCDNESVASFGAINGDNSFHANFDGANDDFGDISKGFPTNERSNTTDKEPTDKEPSLDFASNEVFDADNKFASFENAGDDFGDFTEGFPVNDKGNSNHDKLDTKDERRTEKDQDKFSSEVQTSSSKTEIVDNFKTSHKIESKGSITAAGADGNFGDFADFSENSFGSFSQKSGSISPQNPQNDFGAFSGKSTASSRSSFVQPQYTNQSSISTTNKKFLKENSSKSTGTLRSLQESFPKTFVALQSQLELLKNLKINGSIRINRGKLWTSLCNNSKEGILRFSWEHCKTSDTVCKALEVTKEKISAQSSVLAMTEGLGVPAFATGLGILQPSVVQASPKKKKLKNKKSKEYDFSDTVMPAGFMPVQPSSLGMSKTEGYKDNSSDTASVSDTASLDLEFFASAPANMAVNTDQGSNSSLFNLDYTFGATQLGNNSNEPKNLTKTKSFKNDPLKILQKLDTTKMSATVFQKTQTELSPQVKEIIVKFDDLAFMHSTVLMFPLPKND